MQTTDHGVQEADVGVLVWDFDGDDEALVGKEAETVVAEAQVSVKGSPTNLAEVVINDLSILTQTIGIVADLATAGRSDEGLRIRGNHRRGGRVSSRIHRSGTSRRRLRRRLGRRLQRLGELAAAVRSPDRQHQRHANEGRGANNNL